MDLAARYDREARARERIAELAGRGVVGVALTFVDNAGVARVKAVPLAKLPAAAAWGVGASTSFDLFDADDSIAMPATGEGPVGDSRVMPDVSRLTVLHAQPGWAWAPADRRDQDGAPHPQCSRLLVGRLVDALAADGLRVKASIELEWMVSRGDGDELTPATSGPAYGLTRVIEVSDYCRDLLEAFAAQDVAVEQLHPEYAPSQFELSIDADSPVAAADLSVLARATIRAVGLRHGLRTSYAPAVVADGVGNGGHVHLSLWRGDRNLMAGGAGPSGLSDDGEAFAAGILARLPAVLAVGAPTTASYLRLVPSAWAGAYACWGLENREAALRMITGSTEAAANIEVKCPDLQANPYLLLAALLAAGAAGRAEGARLPAPVDVDPAALSEDERRARGISRLPTSLADSVDAFAADPAITEAFGPGLTDAICVVRRDEIARHAGWTPDEVAAAFRWTH